MRSSVGLALEMAATTEALPYSRGNIKLLLPTFHFTYQSRCEQHGGFFSLYAGMWRQLHCTSAGPQCLCFEDTICKSETRLSPTPWSPWQSRAVPGQSLRCLKHNGPPRPYWKPFRSFEEWPAQKDRQSCMLTSCGWSKSLYGSLHPSATSCHDHSGYL